MARRLSALCLLLALLMAAESVLRPQTVLASGAPASGQAGPGISGVVRTTGGVPIAGVTVEAYRTTGQGYVLAGSGATDATGAYTIALTTPGTHYLKTTNTSGYVNEFYGGSPAAGNVWPLNGTAVEVVSTTVAGIDFALDMGGTVAGQVMFGSTPPNQYAAYVYFTNANSWWGFAVGEGGAYAAQGLPAGSYYVTTDNWSGYVNQRYPATPCVGCPATTGTPVTVTAGQTLSGISFQLAAGGRIHGRVTRQADGSGIADGRVEFYNGAGDSVAVSRTDEDGYFITDRGLTSGNYYLRAEAEGHIRQLFVGITCPGSCTVTNGQPVAVVEGQTTSGVTVALESAGRITGHVLDATTGVGIAGIHVHYGNANMNTNVTTDASGAYAITTLPTGSFTLYTSNASTHGYIDERYDDIPCPQGACSMPGQAVPVTAGQTTSGIDFRLERGGTIRGTVRSTTGSPLANVTVYLYTAGGSRAGSGVTDASGSYTIGGILSGSYKAWTWNDQGYLNEAYPDTLCLMCGSNDGQTIQVVAGTTVSGIDFEIGQGGRIAGTITNEAGMPLADVYVRAYAADGRMAADGRTDAAGRFITWGGVPAGTAYLRTAGAVNRGFEYVDELHSNRPCAFGDCVVTTGTPITITAGQTTDAVDFVLSNGASISGVVQDDTTHAPLPGVIVQVRLWTGGTSAPLATQATTDSLGRYVVRGLGAGTYYLRTLSGATSLSIDEAYGNVPCPGSSCAATAGTPIVVTANQALSGIDFSLAVGGRISGTVTSSDGTGGIYAGLSFFDAAGNYVTGTWSEVGTGTFTTPALPAGTYRFYSYGTGTSHAHEWYGDVPCGLACGLPVPAGAQSVLVTAGQTTGGVSLVLSPASTIQGTVRDGTSGNPIVGVEVRIYTASGSWNSTTTDANGTYAFTALGSGTYYLRTDNAGALGYSDQLYNGLPCPAGNCAMTSGSGIPLTGGQTIGDIDFSLATGGRISGVVRAAGSATPLANVTVSAARSVGSGTTWAGSATTNANGEYLIAGLIAGTYYLTSSNTQGYVDERYNNVTCPANSCPSTAGSGVAVSGNGLVSQIDFDLDPGGRISGTVTSSNGGSGLSVGLSFFTEGGAYAGYVWSDGTTGAFVSPALPAGNYRIYTYGNNHGHLNEWYNDVACTIACGIPAPSQASSVPVAVGQTTGGVNVILTPGGTISGTLTNGATGVRIANVQVMVYTATGGPWFAWTNANGTYSLGGLPAGTYFVRTAASGFVDELYDNRPCGAGCTVTTGTGIAVAQGQTAPGIDFTLAPLPVATNDTCALATVVTSTPYSDLVSTTAATSSVDDPMPGCSTNPSASSNSRARSVYYRYTAPQTGLVTADTFGSNYDTVLSVHTGECGLFTHLGCNDDAASSNQSRLTFVALAGQTYTFMVTQYGSSNTGGSLAFTLAFDPTAIGTISGRVESETPLAGLAGARVLIVNANGTTAGTAVTDANGNFSSVLVPGTYYARSDAAALGYVDELFDGRPCTMGSCYVPGGTAIQVAAGQTAGNVNFQLAQGGRLTGTVTDTRTGSPLANINVAARVSLGSYTSSTANVVSDATGAYSLGPLPAGTYYLTTSNAQGYVDERYADLRCPGQSCDQMAGTALPLAGGQTLTGLDFGLDPGGRISGRVTSAGTGGGLSIGIQFYSEAGVSVGYAWSDSSGNYTSPAFPAGNYRLSTYSGSGVAHVWYGGVACPFNCGTPPPAGAQFVPVAVGQTTTGVDFALQLTGAIAGVLTDVDTGAPVANAWVRAYVDATTNHRSAQTNAQGAYTITGLAPGTYYVRTAGAPEHIDELYDNLPCPGGTCTVTAGTGVPVSAGQTTSGVDFALGSGGRIRGSVLAAGTNAPLTGVIVRAYRADGTIYRTLAGSATTGADGTFAIGGLLQAGDYYVGTDSPDALGVIDETWDNVQCPGGYCEALLGTAIPVAIGQTVDGIDFLLDPGGSIAGTLTDASTGAPVTSGSVQFYNAFGSWVGVSAVDTAGAFILQGLPNGHYYAMATTSGSPVYVDAAYGGLICAFGCNVTQSQAIPVVVGQTTTGINFPLMRGGTISGRVTDATTGAGVTSPYIGAYFDGTRVNYGWPDQGGNYTISGLPPGEYYVKTIGGSQAGYVDELYDDISCPLSACAITAGTPVTVRADTTTAIDFGLMRTGRISGTVLSSANGMPVAGAQVVVSDASDSQSWGFYTSADGTYTSPGLMPGTYFVTVRSAGTHVGQLYSSRPCPGGACLPTTGDPVVVTAGQTTAAIDFSLVTGGAVSGRLTDASTGTPISFGTVRAYIMGATMFASASTDSAGNYVLNGLTTGSYAIVATAHGYIRETYNDIAGTDYVAADRVAVTAGQTTPGVDFALTQGGTITGTVVDHVTGQPIAGASVAAYDARGSGTSATTNAAGVFTIGGLAAGTYYARTNGTRGYVDELFDDVTCGTGCTALLGAPIAVQLGQTTTGIDFRLTTGGRIAGRVVRPGSNVPLPNVGVVAHTLDGIGQKSATTDARGAYTLGGLPAGSYFVRTASTSYANEIYDNIACPSCGTTTSSSITIPEGAVPVPVTVGRTTGGIDFGLDPGASISGRVFDRTTNVPLVDVTVVLSTHTGTSIRSTSVDPAGGYIFNALPPGTYYLRTSVSTRGPSRAYANELYNDVHCESCDIQFGQPVPVAANAAVTGIDFGLDGNATGTVTGLVGVRGLAIPPSDADALDAATVTPVQAFVALYDSNGRTHASTESQADGRFSFGRVPPGTYYMRISGPGHVLQIHENVTCAGSVDCNPLTGTPIVVAANATVTTDVILRLGGSVAGAVTDAVSGAPVYGAIVYVRDASGMTVASAQTNTSGEYFAAGLRTGSYYVYVVSRSGHQAEVHDNQACGFPPCLAPGATPVTVTEGASPTVVDFSLQPGSRFEGRITDAATGSPLSGVEVFFFDTAGALVASGSSAGDGRFLTTQGVAPGTYFARSGPGVMFASQLYAGQACPNASCAPTAGTPVYAQAGQQTRGVDFALNACSPRVTLSPIAMPDATAGVAYDQTLVAANGLAPYTFVTATTGSSTTFRTFGGSLPPGFVFDGATGRLSGTPAEPGRYVIGIGVVDARGCGAKTDYVLYVGGSQPNASGHPADRDNDMRMVISEMTAYGAAWRRGDVWPAGPNPIPIAYVTRAGFLWRSGEAYRHDSGVATCPTCWIPNAATPAGRAARTSLVERPSAVSTLPTAYAAGRTFTVTVAIAPPAGTLAYAIDDTPPPGWTVDAVSHGGAFETVNGTIKWGPFFDTTARTLTYRLTPPPGAATPVTLRGTASFDGTDTAIGADRTLAPAPAAATAPTTAAPTTVEPVPPLPVPTLLPVPSPVSGAAPGAPPTAAVATGSSTTTVAAPAVTSLPLEVAPRPQTSAATMTGSPGAAEARTSTSGDVAVPPAPVAAARTTGIAGGADARGTAASGVSAGQTSAETESTRGTEARPKSGATRSLPASFAGGRPVTVTIVVTPPRDAVVQAIEDLLPVGWMVTAVSDDGVFDPLNGTVTWGPFFDNTSRTLTYQATPPPGTAGLGTFSGVVRFDGKVSIIGGAAGVGPE